MVTWSVVAGTLEAEIANVFATLAGFFDGVVQYNADNRGFEHPSAPSPPSITSVCAAINTGESGAVAAYNSAINAMKKEFQPSPDCLDVSYSDMVENMMNTTLGGPGQLMDRQWVWQTCTEFGYCAGFTIQCHSIVLNTILRFIQRGRYYQSSDGGASTQPFGSLFPIKFSNLQCDDFFGISTEEVAQAIKKTNDFYGGLDYKKALVTVARVIFVNGKIDPWHALSLPPQEQDTNDVPSRPHVFSENSGHDWGDWGLLYNLDFIVNMVVMLCGAGHLNPDRRHGTLCKYVPRPPGQGLGTAHSGPEKCECGYWSMADARARARARTGAHTRARGPWLLEQEPWC
jgi:hypothetical protein